MPPFLFTFSHFSLSPQYDASLRTALLDQHTTHITVTTTLNTTVSELNAALSNLDTAHKSKVGALEKRLAAQEGSVRERMVSLEVRFNCNVLLFMFT